MKDNKQKKGFSIYLVMIIVSVLLSVSLNVASIIVSSAKMSGSLSEGVKAFHAADSGVERALYNLTRSDVTTCVGMDIVNKTYNSDNKFSYSVDIDETISGCPASAKIISTGTYNNSTKRVVEVNY